METMVNEDVFEQVKADVLNWRRYLHQHPELSFQEEQTADFVYNTLCSFGTLVVSRPTRTSVMARLIGSAPGKVLAIRADMDALPIQEENTFDFVSQNPGVMHACGHDAHTAILLGTAKILAGMQASVKGEVRFFFQHAEELFPGGAIEMVEAGVMEGVDMVIGAHLLSTMEIGTFGITYGAMMAAPDTFEITVCGKGGHAAHPHQVIDSVGIASQVVTNIQHIVSRNTDPLANLVISVTQFIAGTAHNVIPGSAFLCGTVRSFDPELRNAVPELMERVTKGITEAHGATYQFNYIRGYSPVVNDDEITAKMEETIVELFGESALEKFIPCMGGEDFSAFMQKAPGTYVVIGAGNQEKGITYPHHHALFTVDEDALESGVKLFLNATFKLLG